MEPNRQQQQPKKKKTNKKTQETQARTTEPTRTRGTAILNTTDAILTILAASPAAVAAQAHHPITTPTKAKTQ